MNTEPLSSSRSSIEFSQTGQLPAPEGFKGFPVQERDWERIKGMADNIVSPISIWQIVWPASFGIAVSSLISAFTILEKTHPNKSICYWLFLLFFVVGILSLIADKRQKSMSTYTKEQLKKEMLDMEKPYMSQGGYSIQHGVSDSASELTILEATWGLPGRSIDVTDFYSRLIVDNRLKAKVVNETVGGQDPAQGEHKVLTVRFKFGGEIKTATVNEYSDIEIP